MTLPDLTTAVSDALFQAGFVGDRLEIAEIAVAAVLRALRECEAVVNVGANALSPGRWSYEDVPQHRDEMTHAILAAIAKLADDE